MNSIFDVVAPALNDLGLLSDDDLDKALKLVQEATRYSALSRNADAAVARKVDEIAEKLIADARVSPDKIVAATTGLPDARAVATIAERIERTLTRQARDLVMARSGEVCGRLNTILAEIADRTGQVAEALAGVNDAQDAINRGVVDEWREAQSLIARYKTVAELIRELREMKVIPRPTGSQTGSHWMFLKDQDASSWLPQDATEWRKHVRSMRRRPWIPASADEAAAVLDQWNRTEVPA